MNQNEFATEEYDDFFDEAPTIVMIRRLLDDAIRDAEAGVDELVESEDLDSEAFVAIGTR